QGKTFSYHDDCLIESVFNSLGKLPACRRYSAKIQIINDYSNAVASRSILAAHSLTVHAPRAALAISVRLQSSEERGRRRRRCISLRRWAGVGWLTSWRSAQSKAATGA